MKIIEMTTNLKMMIHIVRVAKSEMRNIAMTMTMDVKATLHNLSIAIAIYRVPVFSPLQSTSLYCLSIDRDAVHKQIFRPYFQVAHNKL